jgi:hypothetical protein
MTLEDSKSTERSKAPARDLELGQREAVTEKARKDC